MPWKAAGARSFITALSVITSSASKPARDAISKSAASWAGVTLTIPVPKAASTWGSATTGIARSASGSSTEAPTSGRYRSSSGATATPVSPSIVSGRVVETVRNQRPSSVLPTDFAPAFRAAAAASSWPAASG